MWLPFGMLAAFIGWLASGKGRKEVSPVTVSMDTKQWEPVVSGFAKAYNLSLPFCMAWIEIESGGNPCAWGVATAVGPDGFPREQGIAQLYNPDDMTRFKVASGALRGYCVPGTNKCSRKLTADEIRFQADKATQLMAYCRDVAESAARKNGLRWSERDRYRLAKLVHALPGLVRTGVALVTAKLGHPPRDWMEYRVGVDNTKMDAGTEHYRKDFKRLLDNAESVGGAVPSSLSEKAVS